jgi:hypothetical protein
MRNRGRSSRNPSPLRQSLAWPSRPGIGPFDNPIVANDHYSAQAGHTEETAPEDQHCHGVEYRLSPASPRTGPLRRYGGGGLTRVRALGKSGIVCDDFRGASLLLLIPPEEPAGAHLQHPYSSGPSISFEGPLSFRRG